MNRELSNLLATIHRDGGHYEEQHGTEKAIRDAVIVVNRDRINIPGEPAEVFIIEYATQTPDSISMHRRPLRDWPDWVRGIMGLHTTDNHLRLITLMRKNFGELTQARKLPGRRGSELQRQLEQDILSLARELCTPTVDWTQADPSVKEMLLPALRQYRHNDSDEFVSAYDRGETEAILSRKLGQSNQPPVPITAPASQYGEPIICPGCKGSGEWAHDKNYSCPICSGDGVAEREECVTLTGVDSPIVATELAREMMRSKSLTVDLEAAHKEIERLKAVEELLKEDYERVATVLTRDPYDDRDGLSFHIDDLKRLMALPSGTTLYVRKIK